MKQQLTKIQSDSMNSTRYKNSKYQRPFGTNVFLPYYGEALFDCNSLLDKYVGKILLHCTKMCKNTIHGNIYYLQLIYTIVSDKHHVSSKFTIPYYAGYQALIDSCLDELVPIMCKLIEENSLSNYSNGNEKLNSEIDNTSVKILTHVSREQLQCSIMAMQILTCLYFKPFETFRFVPMILPIVVRILEERIDHLVLIKTTVKLIEDIYQCFPKPMINNATV